MDDKTFYSQLLGVESPWKVTSVELLVKEKRVEIRVDCQKETWADDKGRRLHLHGYQERRWRHLDTCQCQTLLIANVPRLIDEDGKTTQVGVPWAEKNSRFTEMFKEFAIRVLLAASSVSEAAELLDISWDQAEAIMKQAVSRGMQRRSLEPIRYVGFDEKRFLRGHSYVTVMTDIEGGRVMDIEPNRETQSGNRLWEKLSPEQRQGVEAVAMDMWEPYLASAKTMAPQALVVHDRFHIVKNVNEAVDQVRRQENKELKGDGDNTLTGTKYSWLKDERNMDPKEKKAFAELKYSALKTARAWGIKEVLSGLWAEPTESAMRNYFKRWEGWAMRSRLEPIKKQARTLRRHVDNIVTYATHQITNALTEGLNAKIQALITNARGFRNFESFRTRILFFCGKLDLTTQKSHANV